MKEYLLLDPSVFDPQQLSSAEIRGLNKSTGEIITIDNIVFPETIEKQLRLQKAAKHGPLWSESRTWYDDLFDDQRYCLSGWISSSLSLSGLALAMDKSLYQETPNGRKGFVRFFDPFVLQHLIVILSASQIGALLYYVDKWMFYDINGEEYCLEISDKSCKKLSFTFDQWESLKRLDIVKHVISIWKKVADNPLPFDATKKTDDQVRRALSYGLVSQLDITIFCLIGLICGKEFDRLPSFKKILSRCADGAGFAEAVNMQNQIGWF